MRIKIGNYDASSAKSAEEAVALCSGLRPYAVISDVIMGKMNGIQLAYHLSATIPESKVLLMSGNALTDLLLAESPAAVDDFPLLAKPSTHNRSSIFSRVPIIRNHRYESRRASRPERDCTTKADIVVTF
jgi:DNA-binding NtrC family response regulator